MTGMSSAPLPTDGYVLGRDYKSNSRLNYEFYLWKETLQHSLHPSISMPTQKFLQGSQATLVADVACGTGIWLRDVATTFPHAQFEGFDIDLSQCPPIQWMPSNIKSLQEWDIFSEPWAELLGRYDIVHVRLLLVVVQNNDPCPIIRNLARLLKPGGYLQWDELNIAGSTILRLKEGLECPVIEGMLQFLRNGGKWVEELPQLMHDSGLEEAKLWRYRERDELAKSFFDNHLIKDEEMASKVGNDEGKQLMERIRGLYEESIKGCLLSTPKVICIAKKPMVM